MVAVLGKKKKNIKVASRVEEITLDTEQIQVG